MKSRMTGAQIARMVGVSQSTVSKAVNGASGVAEETRMAVVTAAQKLGYRLSHGKQLRNVAVIIPAPSRFPIDGYVGTMLSSLSHELASRQIRMEVVQEDDFELLQRHFVDGAIAISWAKELAVRWFELFDLPLVRINAPNENMTEKKYFTVNMDSEGSTRMLIDRLWELGHRKITVLAPDPLEIEANRLRYHGFLKALKAHGVADPRKSWIFGIAKLSLEENIARLKTHLDAGTTALICVDEGAVGLFYRLVHRLKLAVPQAVSLVGWERLGISAYVEPPLASMMIEYDRQSELAVSLLEEAAIHGTGHNVLLPFRFIERESLGPAPQATKQDRLRFRILDMLKNQTWTGRRELAALLGTSPQNGHLRLTLRTLLRDGRILCKYPEAPRSPKQRFALAPAGKLPEN